MIIKEKNQDITFVEYIDNVLPPSLYDNVFNEVNSYNLLLELLFEILEISLSGKVGLKLQLV